MFPLGHHILLNFIQSEHMNSAYWDKCLTGNHVKASVNCSGNLIILSNQAVW